MLSTKIRTTVTAVVAMAALGATSVVPAVAEASNPLGLVIGMAIAKNQGIAPSR